MWTSDSRRAPLSRVPQGMTESMVVPSWMIYVIAHSKDLGDSHLHWNFAPTDRAFVVAKINAVMSDNRQTTARRWRTHDAEGFYADVRRIISEQHPQMYKDTPITGGKTTTRRRTTRRDVTTQRAQTRARTPARQEDTTTHNAGTSSSRAARQTRTKRERETQSS